MFPARLAAATLVLLVATGRGVVLAQEKQHGRSHRPPIIIADQGARSFGGTVLGDFATASVQCDHGYVEWQIPADPRNVPLLMWHSSSTKTWENTFANDEGFKNIFLRRGFPVYVIDAPRLGRAGAGCVPYTYTPNVGQDQSRITSFRLGIWVPPAPPRFYPNVQFPVNDPKALSELLRTSYPEFNVPENVQVQSDGAAVLLGEIGPAVLLTHSGSGIRGWWTAIKSDKVKAIVSYEPGAYVFPQGEVPPPILRADGALVEAPNPPLGSAVPLADFMKLTKFPIQIVFGDNIPSRLDPVNVGPLLTLDNRRISVLRAKLFAEAINRHGGDAEVLILPEVGVFGNTHFAMSDLNNGQVADLLSQFLHEKGLDRRGRHD